MGNQLAERVRNPLEQCVERLLRENVVKHVGETAVRVEECECLSGVVVALPRIGSGGLEEVTGWSSALRFIGAEATCA